MDDGRIHLLKMSEEFKFEQYEEYSVIKAHSARVMGISFDDKKGYIYSIGEDKRFKISDINYLENITDMTIGASPLKFMIFDAAENRIFIANGAGEVYIYSISTVIILYSIYIYIYIKIIAPPIAIGMCGDSKQELHPKLSNRLHSALYFCMQYGWLD